MAPNLFTMVWGHIKGIKAMLDMAFGSLISAALTASLL